MGKALIRRILAILLFSIFAPGLRGLSAPVTSQATDIPEVRLARLEWQTADAKSSADNAWMLTSAAWC
jgi:hypothetical protein